MEEAVLFSLKGMKDIDDHWRSIRDKKTYFCERCGAVWGGNSVISLRDALFFKTIEPHIDVKIVWGNTIWNNFSDICSTFAIDEDKLGRYLCDEFGTNVVQVGQHGFILRGHFTEEQMKIAFTKYCKENKLIHSP